MRRNVSWGLVIIAACAAPSRRPPGSRGGLGEGPDPIGFDVACDAMPAPCLAHVDLDGDGRAERVAVGRGADGRVGFVVRWADGRKELLGAGQPTVFLPGDPTDGDVLRQSSFEFVMRWDTARRSGSTLLIVHGRRTITVPAPDAAGDGLMIDGGDAVIVIYRDRRRWRWRHLGL